MIFDFLGSLEKIRENMLGVNFFEVFVVYDFICFDKEE